MPRSIRSFAVAFSFPALLAVAASFPAAARGADDPPVDKAAVRVEYFGDQIVIDDQIPAELVGHGHTLVKAMIRLPDRTYKVYRVSADADGRFTLAIDARDLPEHVFVRLIFWNAEGDRLGGFWAWRKGPGGGCTIEDMGMTAATCASACNDCGPGSSFDKGLEGSDTGIHTADGEVPTTHPLFSFGTRLMGVAFNLFHQSLKVCDGEMGQGWSHTYNLALVQTGRDSGFVQTASLEPQPFSGELDPLSGITSWTAPEGFYSALSRDGHRRRWKLIHHTGVRYEFMIGAKGLPGPLVAIREPNGNVTRVHRDYSGFVESVVSDLGQEVTFDYDDDGRMSSVTDHLGRTWTFGYDELGNLTTVTTPATELADIASGEQVTDTDLPSVLVTRRRTTTYSYDDPNLPHAITRITDERGAVPVGYTYYHDLPHPGRVATKTINGEAVTFLYDPSADAVPAPLSVLDFGNTVTRVIDREGNVTDYEMHGKGGGPIDGTGKLGVRRTVRWTESGKDNAPLRAGEPLYWERRWLHDCDCLAPRQVSQPFRSDAGLTFDELGMPVDYPTEHYEYNDRRQVTAYEYRGFDASESIRWQKTYDDFAGFSRELTYTEPRAFDDHPIYTGLDFTHTYAYDAAGNRIRHDAPTVTRGVDGQQVITESWGYNDFGQVTSHTDPNGNVSRYTYFDGSSIGGDINTRGEFGGYLASATRGADGSADAVTNLTTRYRVNALGRTTQRIDPMGYVYDYEYNHLGERVREIDAEVTLRNGDKVRYETRYVYDGAGNQVMSRRSNVDLDGTVAANEFIDRSQSFDDVNDLLSSRVEVDGDDDNDFVTRYAYDRNDQLAVVQQPEGNRTFHVYDERRLRFKTFYGVAPSAGGDPAEVYPLDKRAVDLGGTSFVGFTSTTYDARWNVVRTRDGRGHFVDHFYDFYGRRVATSDQNGNGMVYEFDDASNPLTQEGGAVSKATRKVAEVLERSYDRYDEIGRRYQSVLDIDPSSDESADVDPDDGLNSSYQTLFDSGSRIVTRLDANGNPMSTAYDATDRTISVADALANVRSYVYDPNSNVRELRELEVPGPSATGDPELYVTSYVYDELNRRVESHVLGLNGDSIDHETLFAYDSRSNTRLVEDAEGNFTLSTFDNLDRQVLTQRFDGDPIEGFPTELIHYEYAYDRNSRKAADVARSDVDDPDSQQVTLYLYDDLDRLITTIYPDADDFRQSPDGPGYAVVDLSNPDGVDGVYDRVEVGYDQNSNVTFTREQRRVEFTNTYDPGNRHTDQFIALPPSVPGTDRQEYEYDDLNRLTAARNNYSQVSRGHDQLSRQVFERQEIRLDGSGFENGYERPVDLHFEFDRQSNRTVVRVIDETGPNPMLDLETQHSFDALNRMDGINAQYFDQTVHDIVDYRFLGPWRVQKKRLGNGAGLDVGYDVKRRIGSYIWRDDTPEQNVLVGFEYDYDDVDNPLYERFLHDQGSYDNYSYNDRYELIGITYRSSEATDYRGSNIDHQNYFVYDDNLSRRESNSGGASGDQPRIVDIYASNRANEYTEILRNDVVFRAEHDGAGNATEFPVRSTSGSFAGQDVTLRSTWDALGLLFGATVSDRLVAGEEFNEGYRYDPFRRRVLKFDITDNNCDDCPRFTARRYIYDAWTVAEERIASMSFVTDASFELNDVLERVYVSGRARDEPILSAVDQGPERDFGRDTLTNDCPSNANLEYYYTNNRLGSIMALLCANGSNAIFELYRYSAYGRVDVFDSNEMSFAAASARSVSRFGNPYGFLARRVDGNTGILYYRNRYYDTLSGRFMSRDPGGMLSVSLYSYVSNKPTYLVDPLGLQEQDPEDQEPKKEGKTGNFQGEWNSASEIQKSSIENQCCGWRQRYKMSDSWIREAEEESERLTYDTPDEARARHRHLLEMEKSFEQRLIANKAWESYISQDHWIDRILSVATSEPYNYRCEPHCDLKATLVAWKYNAVAEVVGDQGWFSPDTGPPYVARPTVRLNIHYELEVVFELHCKGREGKNE